MPIKRLVNLLFCVLAWPSFACGLAEADQIQSENVGPTEPRVTITFAECVGGVSVFKITNESTIPIYLRYQLVSGPNWSQWTNNGINLCQHDLQRRIAPTAEFETICCQWDAVMAFRKVEPRSTVRFGVNTPRTDRASMERASTYRVKVPYMVDSDVVALIDEGHWATLTETEFDRIGEAWRTSYSIEFGATCP